MCREQPIHTPASKTTGEEDRVRLHRATKRKGRGDKEEPPESDSMRSGFARAHEAEVLGGPLHKQELCGVGGPPEGGPHTSVVQHLLSRDRRPCGLQMKKEIKPRISVMQLRSLFRGAPCYTRSATLDTKDMSKEGKNYVPNLGENEYTAESCAGYVPQRSTLERAIQGLLNGHASHKTAADQPESSAEDTNI
ncbi:hypothetical protein cyc_07215 [Cyclospora cayetanensis]|uniref:Uncharacterized protein n=1 Tax=Cyclospora cayetanensis TaxID=88456 RepID=A0A1D3D1L9_9EIME|nr:hypothetical protein cyc_07215 [Cyclospora cayetanensis]